MPIFTDARDYAVFLSYLKEYLSPKDNKALLKQLDDSQTPAKDKLKLSRGLCRNNFSNEIRLMAYGLMPNHFHLFVKQTNQNAINRFMASICTRYSVYFNRSHNRVGRLFQGVYKAILLTDEAHYLHISRYIHKQVLKAQEEIPETTSSYPEYLGRRKTDWVHPEELLSFFSETIPQLSYERFVSDHNPLYEIAEKELELE
jgi:putative transposase